MTRLKVLKKVCDSMAAVIRDGVVVLDIGQRDPQCPVRVAGTDSIRRCHNCRSKQCTRFLAATAIAAHWYMRSIREELLGACCLPNMGDPPLDSDDQGVVLLFKCPKLGLSYYLCPEGYSDIPKAEFLERHKGQCPRCRHPNTLLGLHVTASDPSSAGLSTILSDHITESDPSSAGLTRDWPPADQRVLFCRSCARLFRISSWIPKESELGFIYGSTAADGLRLPHVPNLDEILHDKFGPRFGM